MNATKALFAAGVLLGAVSSSHGAQWFVSYGNGGSHLQFAYGTSGDTPQYGVLDLASSYMRLNTGPTSGWGTSILTMPSFWSGGGLHMGYPVTATTAMSGNDLVLTVAGVSQGLTTRQTITVSPPTGNAISARVVSTTTGTVTLDTNRPGEAFKPVFLSSMYEGPTVWDASAPFVGNATYAFPSGGWIVGPNPPVTGTRFGLLGGTSSWKTNSPTVEIELDSAMQVAGWLTTSNDPNDDNVGFWAASSTVLPSWSYTVRASQPVPEPATLATLGLGALALWRRRKN